MRSVMLIIENIIPEVRHLNQTMGYHLKLFNTSKLWGNLESKREYIQIEISNSDFCFTSQYFMPLFS